MFSHAVEKTDSLVLSNPTLCTSKHRGGDSGSSVPDWYGRWHLHTGAWSRSLPLFVALCRANST